MRKIVFIIFLFNSCESFNNEKKNGIETKQHIVGIDTVSKIPIHPNYINLLFFNEKLKDEYRWINEVHFAQKHDTVYMSYFVSNGEFINGNFDSLDYAGYFLTNQIVDNQVTFRIKIYRYVDNSMIDEELKYTNLDLLFSNNYDTIYWKVIGNGAYLVQNDTLIPSR